MTPTSMIVRAVSAAALLVLAACATPTGPAPLPPPLPVPPDETTKPTDPTAGRKATTDFLVQEARSYIRAGRLDQGADLLERALRIDPQNGTIWLELAAANLDRGETRRAEQNARKALVLLPPPRHRDAWAVIADARAKHGDPATAAEIRQTWGLR